MPGTDNFFMGGIGEMPSAATQKTLHMIFLVDNSGSMRRDHRMDAVNAAFRQMIPELQRIQSEVQDSFKIMISIMAFNEDPEWITTPTEINYFIFNDIAASQYVTYYSRAYTELNTKLSRKEFFSQRGKMSQPYIMLLTDGAPTEGDDYESALSTLENNGWFHASQRYAVLIGEDTIQDADARRAVRSFVNGNDEGIISCADAEAIASTVSGKTLIIAEQMTQRNGGFGAGEERKGGGFADTPGGGFADTPGGGFGDTSGGGFADTPGGGFGDTPGGGFPDTLPDPGDIFGDNLVF